MSTELADSPTAWFALLERAKRTGDVELALRAQEHLRRLGVKVEFQLSDAGDQKPFKR